MIAPDIYKIHDGLTHNSKPIHHEHFVKWIAIFRSVLVSRNLESEIIDQFISLLSENQHDICSDNCTFNTFDQVNQNPFYIKFIKELLDRIKDLPNFQIYLCPVSEQHKDISNRVCCLFLDRSIEQFNITDEELEQAQQLEQTCPELFSISRIIGELFEEYEMSLDSID